MLDPEYAYKIALRLASKPRFTGSEGEVSAREMILSEFEGLGLEARKEKFSTKTYEIRDARLETIAPERKEYKVSAVGFSGETPPEGLTGELVYIENTCRSLIPDGKGWIGVVSARPTKEEWKFLAKKAGALVIAESNPHRLLSHVSIPYEWREKYGSLPAVYVSFADAYELLSARSAKIVLRQETRDVETYNIVSEIKGGKYGDEVILVTAHYDSVRDVRGAVDNAGGTALVLALAKALSKNDLKRTVRFVLFSAEELGLRGSLAYVESHKEELERIKLVVNLDVHGGMPGYSSAIVTGSETISHYLEAFSKRLGVNLKISSDVMSSDGTSFARKGVPVVNFYRSSGAGADMHTVLDDGRFIHPKAFEITGRIVHAFLLEVLNAEEFMFPREIPENIRKKVREYFTKRLGIFEEE